MVNTKGNLRKKRAVTFWAQRGDYSHYLRMPYSVTTLFSFEGHPFLIVFFYVNRLSQFSWAIYAYLYKKGHERGGNRGVNRRKGDSLALYATSIQINESIITTFTKTGGSLGLMCHISVRKCLRSYYSFWGASCRASC